MPSARKRARSGIVLDNDGTLDALRARAFDAWRRIRRLAAAKECGPGRGALVALVARAGDETLWCGGTLARYVDAGVPVHVACASHGFDPRMHRAAAALGVNAVHRFDAVDPAARIAALAPAVVILARREAADASGAEEMRRLSAQLSGAGTMVYRAAPEDRGDRVAARVDVRPWRDVKRAAWASYGPDDPTPPGERDRWLAAAREVYRASGATTPRTDLFGLDARPVDSPPGAG
jgi:LmbE family N-acetylglucosaminyl deacetylase